MAQPARVPKTVIFLGAGASVSEGAPTQAALFREYFKSYQGKGFGRQFEDIDRELATYFLLFWGVDVDHGDLDKAEFPTFEEALGLLEMAESRAEFFKDFSGLHAELTRGREMRSHLVNLIGRILEEKLESFRGHHRSLISSLKSNSWLPSTTFIGLNYDILVDEAIRSETGSYPDYGIPCQPENGERLGVDEGGMQPVALLKLHGSLNWLLCPTCNVLFFHPYEKSGVYRADRIHQLSCPRCGEPRVPVIVPPTFFKVMSNFFVQSIWRQAEESLKKADKIIFCGYSFPDADIHVKYILKRAEMNRMPPVTPEVYIVNEHNGKDPSQRQEERERYMRFFRDKARIHWTRLSFEEFALNPARMQDASTWMQ